MYIHIYIRTYIHIRVYIGRSEVCSPFINLNAFVCRCQIVTFIMPLSEVEVFIILENSMEFMSFP